MGKKLKVMKLEKGEILQPIFEELTQYNEIKFSDQGIAVFMHQMVQVNLPFTNILCGVENTEAEVNFEERPDTDIKIRFHVIRDQLSRNIISGTTDEFILGENIAAERQLKATIDQKYQNTIDALKSLLKNHL